MGVTGLVMRRIHVRETDTRVKVASGETIVIGGLVTSDKRTVIGKVPLLGDIPLVGFFFRRKEDKLHRLNLLIFLTPTIVDVPPLKEEEIKRLEEAEKILRREGDL